MLLKRKIFTKLKQNLDNRKVLILTGSRQVGKTSLMKMLRQSLSDASKSAFIDFDILSNQTFARSLESFLDQIVLMGYEESSSKTFYLFLDEFQTVSGITNIFKNIYDNYPNIKIIASGSSSLSIKKSIKESLAGRKFIFEIHPLDFEEYLIFQENDDLLQIYKNFPKLKSERVAWPKKLEKHFDEFLRFGGYPEVVLAKTAEEKMQILQSIFDLYLEKDILQFSKVENIFEFKNMLEIIAVQNGQQLNFNNLAKESRLHNKTVRSYIHILEETFLLKTIRPFFSNKKKEIIKTPKVYFMDLGVRNFYLKNFSELDLRPDKGSIFESFVMQEIVKNRADMEIKYWRSKTGQEVDFILSSFQSTALQALEAKYKLSDKKSASRNLLIFLEMYRLDNAKVVSKYQNSSLKTKDKVIQFLPSINFTSRL